MPWYQRWQLYLWQMFQPASRLFFCLLTTLGIAMALPLIHQQTPVISGRYWLAVTSLMLILLYYRLCDEFKDLETDQIHFPERPVPSGRVLIQDLSTMKHLAAIIGLMLNLIWPEGFVAYLALYAFAWGMGKWFFLPNLIGNNRLLAFVTHSPISLFGSFYIMSLFLPQGATLFEWSHVLLALWFALPGFAWEIARKTRAPEHEEAGYQIYSSMLGYRAAACLPPIFALSQIAVLNELNKLIQFPLWFLVTLTALSLFYCLPFVLFMTQPLKYESWLKAASEGYTAFVLILFPLAMIASPITWQFHTF